MSVNHDKQPRCIGRGRVRSGSRRARPGVVAKLNPEPLVHRRGGLAALEPATHDGGGGAPPVPTAPADSIRPAGGGTDPP
jgi:hypothetical protein